MEPVRPEVPLVRHPISLTALAERLAWTRSRPNLPVVTPSCLSKGTAPDSDSCEEVALIKFIKLIWSDITDAPFIDHTIRDVAFLN
tara:strand:+ start:292 stop:549 length:258 start_codon:yes stop_codon:yes gene_type:complete